MEQKSCKFDLKEVDEAKGEFTGWASIYDKLDLGGDIVRQGAFTHTLKMLEGEAPLLWSHSPTAPIGTAHLEDKPKGLAISGKLNLEIPQAKWVHTLMRPMEGFKRAAINGLSFGYDVIKHDFEGQARILKEVKLYEVSPVMFPMNPRATITHVKQANFDVALRSVCLMKPTFESRDQATLWMESNGYKSDSIFESAQSYTFDQQAEEDFDQETLGDIELEPGVSVRMGKLKRKDVGFEKDFASIVQSINELRGEVKQFKASLVDQGFLDDPDLVQSLKFLQEVRPGDCMGDPHSCGGDDLDSSTVQSLTDLLRDSQQFSSDINQ